MQPRLVLFATVALVAAGCLGPEQLDEQNVGGAVAGLTPVRERADLPYVTDDAWSHVLNEGAYGILDALSVSIQVDVGLGNGLPTQTMHMGIFLPDIPGCDWESDSLPEECKVPVIADVGPYYGEVISDPPATEPANRLGKFLIDNFVPHGYAVAQVSVFGTGDSTGCMDLLGPIEQLGVQAAVDHLGTTPWSNGNVGLIGRSYDGSTPWEAAMVPSEHLKTIVPISGLQGLHDLMWQNGSAEDRGPATLWAIYYAFALTHQGPDGSPVDPDQADQQALQVLANSACPDTQTEPVHGVTAYLTGDPAPSPAQSYWLDREFHDAAVQNYEGSVYLIHGLQDWNVDPDQAFPTYNLLEAKGLDVKGLFGQWAHNYPDRLAEHESCDGRGDWCQAPYSVRYDWAQDLLEWFDHYLKGTGAKPELHVEVQDDHGAWRIEKTWPPADLTWKELALEDADVGGNGIVIPGNDGAGVGSPAGDVQPMEPAGTATFGTFDAPLRIAGMPQFHVQVTPSTPMGTVYVEMRDATDDVHLGHAIMDIRFAAGGKTAQPATPGQPLMLHMEFQPMDVVLPAGHELVLHAYSTGMDYLPAAGAGPILLTTDGGSVLRLPVIERGPEAFFAPPGEAAEPIV